jgi:hypothetical protein
MKEFGHDLRRLLGVVRDQGISLKMIIEVRG